VVEEQKIAEEDRVERCRCTPPRPFDKAYAWYKAALPANSQTAHDTSQSQESAIFTLSGGATQQSVSILKTGGVEVTNIALTVTSE